MRHAEGANGDDLAEQEEGEDEDSLVPRAEDTRDHDAAHHVASEGDPARQERERHLGRERGAPAGHQHLRPGAHRAPPLAATVATGARRRTATGSSGAAASARAAVASVARAGDR
jgi:hypothetical protein